jgi:hypothetical protein
MAKLRLSVRSLPHIALATCALSACAASAQPGPAAAVTSTTLADRVRGTSVFDSAGIPIGAIDSSSETLTTVTVDQYKVQVPVNSLRKNGGRIVSSLDRARIANLMAQSARYQQQTHPAPATLTMPAFQRPTGPAPAKGRDTPPAN